MSRCQFKGRQIRLLISIVQSEELSDLYSSRILEYASFNRPQFNQRITQHECEHRSYGNSSGHYRLSGSLPGAADIEADNNLQVDYFGWVLRRRATCQACSASSASVIERLESNAMESLDAFSRFIYQSSPDLWLCCKPVL